MPGKALIVNSSATAYIDGSPTGSWASEAMEPYLVFEAAGLTVDIASVKGGAVNWDPASLNAPFRTADVDVFMAKEDAKKKIEESLELSAVDVAAYDILFFAGGHGFMFDGANSGVVSKAIITAWEAGKVVASVCHGPAVLVGVKTADGEYLVKGRKVTGFTNTEEEAVQKTKLVPFLLEDALKEQGAVYEKGSDWASFAVVDGKLVTGQNPGSAPETAKKALEAAGL